jgi:hypothetical protein
VEVEAGREGRLEERLLKKRCTSQAYLALALCLHFATDGHEKLT